MKNFQGIVVILLLFIVSKKAKETQNDKISGIIFEKEQRVIITADTWTIIGKLNFDKFLQDVAQIQNTTCVLNDINSRIHIEYNQAGVTFDNEIKKINQNLKQYITEAEYFKNLFQTVRTKRGLINLVGHGMNFLYGVATEDQIEHLEDKYTALQDITQSVIHSSDKQISILNEMDKKITQTSNQLINTVEVFKNFTINLEKNWNMTMQNVSRGLAEVFRFTYMATNMRQLELATANAFYELVNLRQAITSTARHKLSQQLLPPHQLLEILKNISNILPPNTLLRAIPKTENLHIFYEHAKVLATFADKSLNVYIRFYIHHKEAVFEAYRPHLIPIYNKELRMWIRWDVVEDMLLISNNKQYYQILSALNYAQCEHEKVTYCISHPKLVHRLQESCLMNLFIGSTKLCSKVIKKPKLVPFLERIENDLVFSTEESTLLNINCDSNVKIEKLEGYGIIKNVKRCMISTEKLKLLPAYQGTTTIQIEHEEYDMQIGNLSMLNYKEKEILMENYEETRDALEKIVKEIKADNSSIKIKTLLKELETRKRNSGSAFTVEIIKKLDYKTIVIIILCTIAIFTIVKIICGRRAANQ